MNVNEGRPPVSPRKRGPDPRSWFGSRFQIGFGLALGLGTLYLALRGLDFTALSATLRAIRLPFVALTLVTSLLTIVLKAVRWRWLFYPQRPALSIGRLAGLIVVGQAVNFYIPARFGELVRAYLTGTEAGVSKAYALGTIAAEKLIDLLMLALLTVALLPFLALPAGLAARTVPLTIAGLALMAGVVVLHGARRTVHQLFGWGLRWLPPAWADRWRTRIAAGLDGLTALGAPRAAAAVWGTTVAFWLTAALTNWLLLLAFDLPPSPLIALFLLAVLQGGIAVPSTPGKVGVFHYLCQLALAVFGVSAIVGFSYGLVLHALIVGSISVWAALALWQRSWNLRALAEVSASSVAIQE